MRQIIVAFIGLVAACPSLAAEAVRGPDGLAALDVTIEADGARPLACAAAIAHWYSTELGRIAPGESLAIALWRDPATGAVYRLNQAGDRMPVERAWCGIEGRAWATRAVLPLERVAGAGIAALTLRCAADGDRVHCRAT